ncbi:MAG: single-stranded-DNA-specific exonuclease RecJ [Chloroflexi bacterium]|nr:single-stranded-DNA-specific exonuclease RecJ [Chloroflexota bacterium]
MTQPARPAKRWLTAPALSPEVEAALTSYHPVLRQLLFNRDNYTAAKADSFLNAKPPADDDPFRITDMSLAVERIESAIGNHEPVAVYGDYDTDGVTATALLVQVLVTLGADARPYIPNRFDEGYGLNNDALDKLKGEGVKLVVTVDCGIRSAAEADHAKRIGLDLIISDHHHVGEALPAALAVINPKREGDNYEEKFLAGVGLAYKMAQALVRRRNPQPINGSDVLDLVALGTVADLAPLTGENRTLVRNGLKVLNKARREGVKSLMQLAGVKAGAADAGTIGFVLGPRLNAAGRLESALAAYDLLTATDVFKANQLASQLNQQNRDRQDQTKQITAHAREIALADDPEAPFLFAAHESYNEGVVGLAAARLTEEFYRPAAVARIGDKDTKGSARSIKEFHITEALDSCRDLLIRHGGHAAAAGFTLANENVAGLAERLRQYAADKLANVDLRPALRVDMNVQPGELSLELALALRQLEPCGYGNPAPLFSAHDLEVKYPKAIGADGSHLKLYLSDGTSKVEGVAFRQAHWLKNMPNRVDVVYALELNEWQGETKLQMNVKDLRKSIV